VEYRSKPDDDPLKTPGSSWRRATNQKRTMSKTATKTAAKKAAKPKQAGTVERVNVRILKTGEYHTGTTSFVLAKGKRCLLPKTTAEAHAKKGNVAIL